MAEVEIGRIGVGEIPTCPDNIQRRLREFDRRLRMTFNVNEGCWQVQEFLEKSGVWSHVCFWADGQWPKREFRPLPPGAEPIIAEVCKRDLARHETDLAHYAKELDSRGATERAERARQMREKMHKKLRDYMRWCFAHADDLKRRYNIGGSTQQGAINERMDALRDMGLR